MIRKWQMNGLPSDNFSTENGIITYKTKRWPLFIDPQGQAARWIKANESENKVVITKQTDSGFIRHLENSISFGQVLVIENVKEEIDSVLDPILGKQTFKNAGILSIKVADNIVDYSKNFKLFMMTKLRNPHFTPEISTKMTLVNFAITKEGLIDQLLELCIQKEEPEDGEMRSKLIVQGHQNKQQLEEIEQQILDVLNKADNILEDEEGVKVLAQSREIANDIEEKQQIAEEIEERIETSRLNYTPIATHSSVLFFVLMNMGEQDFMYQYSLTWFLGLYSEAFDKAKKSEEVETRVANVINYFTHSFYSNVCRSLFEKDKLLFSFLLQIKLLENADSINPTEYNFFISPINVVESSSSQQQQHSQQHIQQPNPFPNWLPDLAWLKFLQLSKISGYFMPILNCISDNENVWRDIYYDPNAHQASFPEPFANCTQLQRLCILKCIRPDRIVRAAINFIKSELGDKFTSPPPFNLNLSFQDSSWYQPLVFVLPGTDPMSQLISFSQQKNKELESISLGQGQGAFAEKAINEAKESGNWVILQNCHLAPSWMPKLERICEDMLEISQKSNSPQQQQQQSLTTTAAKPSIHKHHPDFRLFLTSYPTNTFPVSILQNSVKMTNEPPKGLKSNLTVSYMGEQINNDAFFEMHPKPNEFKTLLYGLCFFHSILQERRNFGPLGWNIYYDFNQSDLRISVRQLHLFLADFDFIPYKALHYMIGECNYGGRVTDDRDRRILKALLNEYLSASLFSPDFCFATLPQYTLPHVGKHADYLKSIELLPNITSSQLFGFHENGEIVKDLKETDELCDSLLLLSGGSSSQQDGSTLSIDDKLKEISNDILGKLPKKFDMEIAETKYPIEYKNSMNTVLQQEIIRYNNLTNVIKNSLNDLQNALEGTVVMSEQLENVGKSLSKGLVPALWKKISYPSLKPLGAYIKDLIERLDYFHQWIDDQPHSIHWISGYFFTQAFLTATSQNYARKYQIPIDTLVFEFSFFDKPSDNVQEQGKFHSMSIQDGSLTYGLYLEGCSWDYDRKQLRESEPKILHEQAPIILIKPVEVTNCKIENTYSCPVYKTAERKGTLSTTGHSTNFIMNIDLPSEQPEQHWVKRGVAMLCQLTE